MLVGQIGDKLVIRLVMFRLLALINLFQHNIIQVFLKGVIYFSQMGVYHGRLSLAHGQKLLMLLPSKPTNASLKAEKSVTFQQRKEYAG